VPLDRASYAVTVLGSGALSEPLVQAMLDLCFVCLRMPTA
jgi:hypothetical protein